MTSLSTPCPASFSPAPGPLMVTSPTGSAVHTTALVVPSMFTSGSSRPTSSGCTRAITSPLPSESGKLSVATCLIRPPAEAARSISERATSVIPWQVTCVGSKLPAEDEGGEDHHLCHCVVPLDVCRWVTLGEAHSLCLPQRVLVGAAAGHPREDEVGSRVQQTTERGRDRPRETVDQGAQHRCTGHDGGLGAKGDAAGTRQLGELHAVQGDGPLVGRDHGDPPLQRLAHVAEAGLAVGGRARRHLHEKIRLGGPQPFDRSRPAARARLLGDRPSLACQRERGRQIEAVLVIDEPVAGIAETHDRHADPIPLREPPRLNVKRTDKPLTHRAKADDPDTQRFTA